MRALPQSSAEYAWAPSTEEIARRVGLDPVQILRFDGNVAARSRRRSRARARSRARSPT